MTGIELSIDEARPSDLPQVRRLLARASLPLAGLDDAFESLLVARRGGRVVACIGLERRGASGLLRSAAVAPTLRGKGLGAALTSRLLRDARASGVRAVYLLTTTAADYFERFGFERIDRSRVPAAVRGSEEFRGACPASAVAMRLRLRPRSGKKVQLSRRTP